MAYKSILIAVDSSIQSKKAFERAVKVAIETKAKLTITHIVDVPTHSDYRTFNIDLLNSAKTTAQELLDKYKEEAIAAGIAEVTVILEAGSPKREIIKTIVPKILPDLIVVGATGTNALERVLIGSVSEYILRHAPIDVLVVR